MEISYCNPTVSVGGVVSYPSIVYTDEPVIVGPQDFVIQGGSSNSIQIQGSAAGTYLFPGY